MTLLGDAEWKLISDVIESRFGLVFDGVRREILEARLAPRLQQLHLQTFLEYYHYLSTHPAREAEFAELSRRITNNETYFFREQHHFDVVVKHVVPTLAPELRSRPLRVLSAGCSSGEEPYSLVIALQDAGLELSGYRWEIDACDLNPNRIAQAREAWYETNSLRAGDPEMRSRYFTEQNGRYQLKERYRKGVRFFEANVVSALPGNGWGRYDTILCRNLLIYFSGKAFYDLIGAFARALSPGGYLLLGHSESLIDKVPEFVPVYLEGAMVYRRIGGEA